MADKSRLKFKRFAAGGEAKEALDARRSAALKTARRYPPPGDYDLTPIDKRLTRDRNEYEPTGGAERVPQINFEKDTPDPLVRARRGGRVKR